MFINIIKGFIMKELRRRFLLFVLDSSFTNWFVLKVLPYLRLSTYYTELTGADHAEIKKRMKKGYIIFSTDKSKLASALIGGLWAHAAIVESGDSILEMTRDGFTRTNLYDFCRTSDYVAIGRGTKWYQDYIDNVIFKNLAKYEEANVKYDTKFSFGIKTLYCSEMVYLADEELRLGANTQDLAGLGREYISPDGLFKAKHFQLLWTNHPKI